MISAMLMLLFLLGGIYVLVSLVRPLPPFRTRIRTLFLGVPGLFAAMVVMVLAIVGVTTLSETKQLEQLKTENPEAYESEMKKREAEQKIKEAAEREEERKEAEADRKKALCSDQITASIMAQGFVEERLKSPSTADFPSINKSNVQTLGCGHYRVSSYVDAQNSFGAMLRTRYVAVLRTVERGVKISWRLEFLEM